MDSWDSSESQLEYQSNRFNSKNLSAHWRPGLKINKFQPEQFDATISSFTQASKVDNGYLYKLVDGLLSVRKEREAIQCLHDAVKAKPQDSRLYKKLAQIYKRQHQYEKAIEAYQKQRTLAPKDKMVYLNLAELFIKLQKTAEAVDCYSKVIELDSKCPDAYLFLRLALSQIDIKQALRFYRCGFQASRESKQAWYCLKVGDRLTEIGHYKQAVFYFEKCLELRPEQDQAFERILMLKNTK